MHVIPSLSLFLFPRTLSWSPKVIPIITCLALGRGRRSPRCFVSRQAVVAEFYDEVVFTDPYEEFYNTLMQGQKLLPQRKHEHQEHFSTFSDGDTLQRLAAAREWVHNQLRGEPGASKNKTGIPAKPLDRRCRYIISVTGSSSSFDRRGNHFKYRGISLVGRKIEKSLPISTNTPVSAGAARKHCHAHPSLWRAYAHRTRWASFTCNLSFVYLLHTFLSFVAETKDRIRKADMDMAQLKASATASSGRGLGRGSTAQTSQTSQVRR